MRFQYAEAVNKNLFWGQQAHTDEAKRTVKRVVGHYWDVKDGRRGVRYSNADRGQSPDNPNGVRPGRNIEDVERGVMDRFLFGDTSGGSWKPYEYDHGSSPLQNIRSFIARQQDQMKDSIFGAVESSPEPPKGESPESARSDADRAAVFERDYTIDPITNRKVSKSPRKPRLDGAVDIPIKTFKKYRSQFAQFRAPEATESPGPIFYDGPPPPSELQKYRQVEIDESPPFPEAPRDGLAGQRHGYSDLDKYKPVMHNETASADEALPKYDDLAKYGPVMQPERQETDASLPKYGDTDKYKAFRYNEPDGKPPSYTESYTDSENPEELRLYKPFMYNEPDGKPPGPGEPGYDPAEVRKYKAFRWNEPDGKPDTAVEGRDYDPVELNQYEAVKHNEPDGKAPAVQDQAVDSSELGDYQAVRYNEPNGQPPVVGAVDDSAAELPKYTAVRHNEPDGKPAPDPGVGAQTLKELASPPKDSGEASASQSRFRSSLEPQMSRLRAASDVADQEALAAVKSIRSRAKIPLDDAAQTSLTGNYVQDFPEDFAQSWTSVERDAAGTTLKPKETTGDSDYAAAPAARASTIQGEEREYAETVSARAGSTRLEPSLDRQHNRLQILADPYSTSPQGLETSYVEECNGERTWPAYVKVHKAVDAGEEKLATASAAGETAHRGPGVSAPAADASPTVYKILAYDPTMQSINVAETSSVVPDTGAALTPAEVLLRLSNPTKFFPHFAPLQAEGFEIASGSGDVLVFRKVQHVQRPAKEPTPPPAPVAAVNPIDMTGTRRLSSPAAANFASPTGYVNYELPAFADGLAAAATLPPPPTRFRSNIDVRREEPVFSGPKVEGRLQQQQGQQRAGQSVSKRMLVGAAWLAGVSYALGVVGEYFKTGGIDGAGPTGF